jgi:hypothetical protein
MSKFKLFLSVVSVMMLCSGQALATSGCHDVHLDASDTAVDPMLLFGRYAGTAQVSLDGQPALPAAVSFIPAEIKIGDDGTVHLTNVLNFDLGPMGTLSVQDNAVLSPTENPYIYTMNSRLDNLVGTGMFTGAFGKFSDHGQFNLATATVSASADGRICW